METSNNMTIRDWFKRLPEPYKKRALMNAYLLEPECLSNTFPTLCDALMYSFEWTLTNQGFDYWDKLYEAAYIGEFDKIL